MEGKFVPVNITPEGVLKKYKPLRKIRVPLVFCMVYFPFYLVDVQGYMSMGFVKKRNIGEQRAVNGISQTISTVLTYPSLEETSLFLEKADTIIIQPEANYETSKNLAVENVVKHYNKKYGGFLRPKLTLFLEAKTIERIYKPYWVITNGEDRSEEMMIIIDAVTGIAGAPESNAIKKKLIEDSNLHIGA